MTVQRTALLVGLLLTPALLLWLGHGFRDLPRRWKHGFWGGVIGEMIGVALVATILVFPPVQWQAGGWRDAALHWSLVVLPLLGLMAGAVRGD